METKSSTLRIHEYPYWLWLIGLIIDGLAIDYLLVFPTQKTFSAIMMVIGLISVTSATSLIITADRSIQRLTIQRRRLLWSSKKEIPFNEIADVYVEASRGLSDSGPTYRVVIQCKNGQIIPFHSFYSSGATAKEKKAATLRDFLGVGGMDETPPSIVKLGHRTRQQQFLQLVENQTDSETEEQVTDGVHWKVRKITWGQLGVTRWLSTDFRWMSGFLCLAQKEAEQEHISGKLLEKLVKKLTDQTLNVYGFIVEVTPGLENPDQVTNANSNLEPHFSVFTSNPEAARKILNPRIVALLMDWAGRHPLTQLRVESVFQQMMVFLSPNGVYVAAYGHIIPDAADELKDLGVVLVKALRRTAGRPA